MRECCENEKGIARDRGRKKVRGFLSIWWWDFLSGALTLRGPPASIERNRSGSRITRTCAHKGARCVLSCFFNAPMRIVAVIGSHTLLEIDRSPGQADLSSVHAGVCELVESKIAKSANDSLRNSP